MNNPLGDVLSTIMVNELNAVGRKATDNLRTFITGLGVVEAMGANIDDPTKALCCIERAIKLTIDVINERTGRDFRAEVESRVQDTLAKADAARELTKRPAPPKPSPSAFMPDYVEGCDCSDCADAREQANRKGGAA